jgi:signal transduction histidine kinase
MLLILLDNALKFSRRGGEVAVNARKKGKFVAFEVQDNGPGVDKEEQKWLFEPYNRPHGGGNLSGLGLGLALLKMLAELQGGKVWVNSEQGKGATFGFSIPLKGDTKDGEDNK